MKEIILSKINSLCVGEDCKYHVHDVTNLDIRLPERKIMKPSIVYLHAAANGIVNVRILNNDTDLSMICNGETWKMFVNPDGSIDAEKLDEAVSGGQKSDPLLDAAKILAARNVNNELDEVYVDGYLITKNRNPYHYNEADSVSGKYMIIRNNTNIDNDDEIITDIDLFADIDNDKRDDDILPYELNSGGEVYIWNCHIGTVRVHKLFNDDKHSSYVNIGSFWDTYSYESKYLSSIDNIDFSDVNNIDEIYVGGNSWLPILHKQSEFVFPYSDKLILCNVAGRGGACMMFEKDYVKFINPSDKGPYEHLPYGYIVGCFMSKSSQGFTLDFSGLNIFAFFDDDGYSEFTYIHIGGTDMGPNESFDDFPQKSFYGPDRIIFNSDTIEKYTGTSGAYIALELNNYSNYSDDSEYARWYHEHNPKVTIEITGNSANCIKGTIGLPNMTPEGVMNIINAVDANSDLEPEAKELTFYQIDIDDLNDEQLARFNERVTECVEGGWTINITTESY